MRNNRIETVKFLLEQGANVNDRIPDGTSALSMAILNADFDLAALLLDAGANPNVPDPRGHPLHVVVWLHQPGAPPDFAMNGEDPRAGPASPRQAVAPRHGEEAAAGQRRRSERPDHLGRAAASAAAAWRATRPT